MSDTCPRRNFLDKCSWRLALAPCPGLALMPCRMQLAPCPGALPWRLAVAPCPGALPCSWRHALAPCPGALPWRLALAPCPGGLGLASHWSLALAGALPWPRTGACPGRRRPRTGALPFFSALLLWRSSPLINPSPLSSCGDRCKLHLLRRSSHHCKLALDDPPISPRHRFFRLRTLPLRSRSAPLPLRSAPAPLPLRSRSAPAPLLLLLLRSPPLRSPPAEIAAPLTNLPSAILL
jgi:hypothetical protein